MKIPKTFQVKGKTWSVEYKWKLSDPEFGPCHGLCDPDKRIIYIDRLQPQEEKVKTFIHELGHAILFESHLNECGGVEGFVEEVIVSAYADVFYDLFEIELRKAEKAKTK